MKRWNGTNESGMSISMVVLAMTIVAFIMLFVGSTTMNSLLSARKKSENSVGIAAGDSGVEKIRAALQQRIMGETTDFLLDEATLKELVKPAPGHGLSADQLPTVLPNASAPGANVMTPVRVPAHAQFTVREPGVDTVGYWQVYDVIEPRFLDTPTSPASNVVVYLRAWATAKNSNEYVTKPRVFRIEYRPGYFSDYQSVTDAPFFLKQNDQVTINGPIHSNGFRVADWLARDNPLQQGKLGIWMDLAPNCGPKAKFTTSQGAPIVVPGGSCSDAVGRSKTNARQINLLGTEDTYRFLESQCAAEELILCRNGSGPYNVELRSGYLMVNGERIDLVEKYDSATRAILFDDTVHLRGALSHPGGKAARLTLATRRKNAIDIQPQVVLHRDAVSGGVVGAANTDRDSVGVVTQGDVVLSFKDGTTKSCLTNVNLAVVSGSGSVTLPPEWVTIAPPPSDLTGWNCDGGGSTSNFTGSFAAHGQFIPSINWALPDGTTTGTLGYPRARLSYAENLFLNPPPFFPLATPWQLSKVKDANAKCLVPPNAGDPQCE